MENFNVSKYFRDKLFEQEDQLEPKDDDVDSAFTKGEEPNGEPQPEEPVEKPKVDKKEAAINKAIEKAEVEVATRLDKNINDVNPKVLNKKSIVNSIRTVKNSPALKDQFEYAYEFGEGKIEEPVTEYQMLVVMTYMNKYHLPSLEKVYVDDIDEALEHLSFLFDNSYLKDGKYSYYKDLKKWQSGTMKRKYTFNDSTLTNVKNG